MLIYILGSTGQLGRSFSDFWKNRKDVEYISSIDFDLCNPEGIKGFFNKLHEGDIVVNCAAYTAVDKAEEEKDKCYSINAFALKEVGRLAFEKKVKVIHFSTDYVFNGKQNRPYLEIDQECPLNEYGRSKLDGEKFLLESGCTAIVIRVSWLYSPFGKNFFLTMLNLSKQREHLSIVSDQHGTPTYTYDLVEVVEKIILDIPEGTRELFHFSNSGEATWFDFAKEIFERKGISCKVEPILTKDYPTAAKRPLYSVLDKEKIKKRYNIQLNDWRKGVEKCLKKIS